MYLKADCGILQVEGEKMKIMYVSDIHGRKTNLEILKQKYLEHQCEKLVCLGDLYYLSSKYTSLGGFDPEYVQSFLESFGENFICLRGNCDSNQEVEESPFPMKDLVKIADFPQEIYATHGHLYHEENWNKDHTILVYGHTHVPFIHERGNCCFINTGSISLPFENYLPSYMIQEENTFTIYDISGKILFQKKG